MENRRRRLDTLTERWRSRHEARRPPRDKRPPADPEREQRAMAAFPFRETSPQAYADAYGEEMTGFTYDEYRYAEAELDMWLQSLGAILRERREGAGG